MPPSDDLILQYFAGKLTGNDEERVRRYFEASPELRGLHAGLRLTLQSDELPNPPDTNAEIAHLLRRIDAERASMDYQREDRVPAVPSEPNRRAVRALSRDQRFRRGYGGWAAFAMTLVVAAVTVTGLWHRTRVTVNPTAVVMRELATQRGQRMTMQLADGSSVTLAPQTRLQISRTFGNRDRTVVLEGEAYFDVSVDKGAPFIVKTRGSDVRVLGTRFDVRAYDTTTAVAVVTGKVSLTAVHATAPSLIVTANHVGMIEANGDARVHQDDLAPYTEWMQGRLVFRNTPVPDVLERLGRWYGVRLLVDNPSLARKQIYADWRDRSLESVLPLLADALGARIVRDGDQITLHVQ